MAEGDPIEHGIATTLARYLDGSRFDEQAALLDVISDLSFLLGQLFLGHLADEELWSPYWWIDDAIPEIMEPVDAETVAMTGLVWLLADSSANGYQPFHATFRLGPSRDSLASYTLEFGDAAIGLGPTPDSDRRLRSWPVVDRWLFEFTGPDASQGTSAKEVSAL